MSDDWVNDPYDEAPVHVLDDEGEPDADVDGGFDTDDGAHIEPKIEPETDAPGDPGLDDA